MVGLRNKAVLEIDLQDGSGDTRTGEFHIREDLNASGEVTKQFLISNPGQYIREAADVLPQDITDEEAESRRGYTIDSGGGTYAERIDAKAGDRDAQWGDGSSDPDDPADITKYDATGCDTQAQKQIFQWYISQAKTDSLGKARLHIGEWTDGSHSDAGVFGKPLVIAIREANISRDPDDPGTLELSLECVWTAVLPEDVVDEAQQSVDELSQAITE